MGVRDCKIGKNVTTREPCNLYECEIGDAIVHCHVESDDEDSMWDDQPIFHNDDGWYCFDVEGRRRPTRSTRKQVDYSETRRRAKKPPSSRRKARKPVGSTRDSAPVDADHGSTSPSQPEDEDDSDGEPPPLISRYKDSVMYSGGSGPADLSSDEESDDEEDVRIDSNNKAKFTMQNDVREATPYLGKPAKIHYPDYARYFGGLPERVIEQTFKNTTQLGRRGAVQGLKLWKRLKAPNMALNVPRRNEPVATDTIYGTVPAIDDGSTAAQLFVGRKSGFLAVESLGSSDKRFPVALMNHTRRYGAMDLLISDNAKAEISQRVQEILGTMGINSWTSEAENKNLNFAERAWRDVKRMVEQLLNYSNAPAWCWLLALECACFILNHSALERLGWRTPCEWLLGYTPDISVLLQFVFYEPVYYQALEGSFPADPQEALGRFVGIAETTGNAMTFKILTAERKIISRSVVRSANKGGVFQNLRANDRAPKIAPVFPNKNLKVGDKAVPVVVETVGDEDQEEGENTTPDDSPVNNEQREFITSLHEESIKKGASLPTIDVTDILNRTFITTPDEDGEQKRAKIEDVEVMEERTPDGTEPLLKFKCSVGQEKFEEIMTYNRMLQWCEQAKDADDFFRLTAITGHRKMRKARGGYQVRVLWASGEVDWRDFADIFADDPVTVSIHAKKNDLLNTPGWRQCRRYIRNAKSLGRAINQVRLKNHRNRPVYKCGYQVPRNHTEAMKIDERDGNTKWADSERLETKQLADYECFKDLGKGAPVPEGYTKIPCHFVYDVKHDGRYKSRFVAGGHRTSTPIDSVYSGVVSLRGIRTVAFLAELNDLELWGTDVGNAYLESWTKEKVCFVAGPEFGELEGHLLVIQKAQYGLKSSGKCWHDKLCDTLRSMGFFPSKAEDDIWMRDRGDHYEYVAVCVDDILIASKNPQAIADTLTSPPINFKLKGTGPVTFHLGCDFTRDEDGTPCVGPRRYIDRMTESYKRMFGEAPRTKYHSPLEKNDHPELDTSELLDADGISKCQSLIGTLQWVISLGRFDIATAVMTMSGFRVAPRVGHLERVKRICGCLAKFQSGCIRVRTGVPDYSDLPNKEYDWSRSVCGEVRECLPTDAPPPKGKPVVSSTHKDANLLHCLMTGRAVSGILHFFNQTPIDWFSKKQPTVETATHGSEFVAAKLAIQQISALRLMLRYLGVNLVGPSYLFGDNESVVTSGTIPHSQLSKRHMALSCHYTREAVASKMVAFHHIPGAMNPADILSKHWGYAQVYPLLRPVLFYKGDTIDLVDKEPREPSQGG